MFSPEHKRWFGFMNVCLLRSGQREEVVLLEEEEEEEEEGEDGWVVEAVQEMEGGEGTQD